MLEETTIFIGKCKFHMEGRKSSTFFAMKLLALPKSTFQMVYLQYVFRFKALAPRNNLYGLAKLCWFLSIRPEFCNAMNNLLKKKCLFSLSVINARWQSLFYTDLYSAIVGKMGSSAGFSVVYVYTAELFPTQVHII
jgi:hypothetical protein